MKLLQETTEWRVPTPNHVYIFNGSENRIAGFIREGTTIVTKFTKPMGFDKRGRTFVPVSPKNFDLQAFKD